MLLRDGIFNSAAYDTFVVGSGPAGMTVATELGRAGRRVLILESGGASSGEPVLSSTIGYGHYSDDYWNNHWIRTIGGTSAVWAGWCVAPRPFDFDNPATGVRWPIAHADLIPYWDRAAALLETDAHAIHHERPVVPGFAYRPFVITPPLRFGERYGPQVAESPRIDLLPGCSVVGLDANDGRSAVTAIDYYDHQIGGGRRIPLRPSQRVVLAAGGIGNAHLLIQPRPDGSVSVGNESGVAGTCLMEHPMFTRIGECVIDLRVDHLWPGGRGFGVHGLIAEEATAREHHLHGCHLEFGFRGGDHPVVAHLGARYGRPFFRYVLAARLEMLPSAANRVFITGERERSGLYRAAARCVLDARDFINVETTLRALGDSLARHGRGRVRVNNDRIYKDVRGEGHIMGTTRMGTSRSSSVVDSDCRVHGYGNLFVAGSSVFPTSGGYPNPTVTIVALALRLADTLTHTS